MDRAEDSKEFLITAVGKRKILYDASSVSNRNKYLKEQAWKEVSEEIGMDVLWSKSEWAKLRDVYRKKKKQIIGKTGQARARIEAWPYFNVLQFLDDYLIVASTSGNMDSQASTPDSILPEDLETGTMNSDVEDEIEPGIANVDKCVTYSRKRHGTGTGRTPPDPVDVELVNYLKRPRDDEYHYFGMDIAAQLRRMEPELSSYAKFQIAKVMFECKHQSQSVTILEATDNNN